MISPTPTILYFDKLSCSGTSGETGDDDIVLKISIDDGTPFWTPSTGSWHFPKGGGTKEVDVAINVTYANKIFIEIWEKDSSSNTSSKNDYLGSATIKRGNNPLDPNANYYTYLSTKEGPANYTLIWRVISQPILTARVLGVYCERQTAGVNVNLVSTIADVAGDATKAAGNVISKSPRPRAKVIGEAFKAASKVLEAVDAIAEWIGDHMEGDYDEVYMRHIENTRGVGGAFFPPQNDFYRMQDDMTASFEEMYGHYFRFPLDREPVTLELKEHDAIKGDINIGTLVIAPDNMTNGTSNGIEGSTVNGGVAIVGGPAVVEIATTCGIRAGEGAIYHICYSVGFEDWCKPATTDGQGDPNDA